MGVSQFTSKRFSLSLVALIVVAIGTGVLCNRPSPVEHTPDGRWVKLDRYSFAARGVRYEFPDRPLVRALRNVLPASVTKNVQWFQVDITTFAVPTFPKEPFLSVSFSVQGRSGDRNAIGTRVAVSDDRGQFFDPVVNSGASQGVFEVKAFPRRGRELRLRLMKDDELQAEFRIPNPCPGPHPIWKAEGLPQTATNGTLEITLEKFQADRSRSRTICLFRVRDSGRESTAWRPVSFEISDATGNHWYASRDNAQVLEGTLVKAGFLGALWPEEDAWKMVVRFATEDMSPMSATLPAVTFLAKPEQVPDSSDAR